MTRHLEVLPELYAICRLVATAPVPEWATGPLVSVTRTAEELSVVCPEARVPEGVRAERRWRVLKVEGPLDFGLTGVLATLVAPLAAARIPVFVVSTYDTDWVLVKEPDLVAALRALDLAGWRESGRDTRTRNGPLLR